MSQVAPRLLSASYFQRISSVPRHRLRARRTQPSYSLTPYQKYSHHRTFTSSTRLRKSKDDGNVKDEATKPVKKAPEMAKEADEVTKSADTVDPIVANVVGEATDKLEQVKIEDEVHSNDVLADLKVEDAVVVGELNGEGNLSGRPAAATEGDSIAGNLATSESSGAIASSDSPMDVETSTILAHGDSEAHRDLREYARLAAWELPLLHKLKKPFEPPTSATPLRFRYTSYMGEEHPAAKKVVVEFKPAELPGLNKEQQIKLIKLAGPRYNPEKQSIKMSCESFETPAQNKRYLGDLVQKLIVEAKDPKDSLKDIPIDLRHHKQKRVYKFPEEWKIQDPTTIAPLRKTNLKREVVQQLQESGDYVDGSEVIREALANLPRERLAPKLGEKQRVVLGTKSGTLPAKGQRGRNSTLSR